MTEMTDPFTCSRCGHWGVTALPDGQHGKERPCVNTGGNPEGLLCGCVGDGPVRQPVFVTSALGPQPSLGR